MDTPTLKTDLHQIIDELDDEELLEKFYQEVLTLISNSDKLWDKLSKAQQQEVLKSLEESKHKNNLADHETVIKKYKSAAENRTFFVTQATKEDTH